MQWKIIFELVVYFVVSVANIRIFFSVNNLPAFYFIIEKIGKNLNVLDSLKHSPIIGSFTKKLFLFAVLGFFFRKTIRFGLYTYLLQRLYRVHRLCAL